MMVKKVLIMITAIVLSCVGTAKADLLFSANYNSGWDADYAAGNGTATVSHDDPDVYADIALEAGSVHHYGSGAQHTNAPSTGEYVTYNAAGNVEYAKGTYVAWSKPLYAEGGYTPYDGFLVATGGHWSYNNSIVMDTTHYYSYNHDYRLWVKDSVGNGGCIASVQVPGYGDNTWVLTVGSWELVDDGAGGYNMNGTMNVRREGAAAWSTGSNSKAVTDAWAASIINIGSDLTGANWIGGNVDDVMIYNHVLDATAMQAIYDAGPGVPEPATIVLLGLGLLGFRKRK